MSRKNSENQPDADFEIRFLEGILRESPNFKEALAILGNLYTKRGLYAQGLEVDKKLARLKPFDPIVFYNLACSYSLLEDIPRALETLKEALSLGYDDFHYLMADADLVNLRQDTRFHELVKQAQSLRPNRGHTP